MRSKHEIIPGDLVTTVEDFIKRLEFARAVGNSIHADVLDGQFVEGEGLAVKDWPMLDIEYAEAHLMVNDPLSFLSAVKAKGATRAIVHVEAQFDPTELKNKARELDLLLGFAVNPETDLSKLHRFFEVSNYIQVMGVHPGRTGQSYQEQTPLAVSYLRRLPNHLIISVDGGVGPENIQALRQAGAHYFVASSSLYSEGEWQDNYQQLLDLAHDNKTA